jgi:hypothetical protein
VRDGDLEATGGRVGAAELEGLGLSAREIALAISSSFAE